MYPFQVAIVSALFLGASAAAISWGQCPPSQNTAGTFNTQCANISYPLNYANPTGPQVNAFVRRVYANAPTDNSIWIVAGGPGDSTLSLSYFCQFFVGSNSDYTCYSQDARGTGLSSYMSCGNKQPYGPFNPYNETVKLMFSKCIDDIIATYGDDLQYYSTYYAQMDLLSTIKTVNPSLVHIYAQSYGTYALNTYMQLPGARYDAVVLDGPVPPNRWPLENNAEWVSRVGDDVTFSCVTNSSVCRERMSVMGHIPRLVMDAIIDGTLPCIKNLTWLQPENLGQFWVAQYANSITGGGSLDTAHTAFNPFWYRLHRCSASDIQQLNLFNARQQIANGPSSAPQPDEYSFGAAVNIAASKVYSFSKTPLSYELQVQRSSRMLSSAGVEMLIAFARNVTDIPLYQVNPSYYMKFATITAPVLILVGTLDSNTENGLGYWFQEGLGNMSTLLNVPYNAHVTICQTCTCANSLVLQWFDSLGKSLDSSCLAGMSAPDWDGSSQAVQEYSNNLFGTYDLWNDGFLLDEPASPTCSVNIESANSCSCHSTAIIAGIVVPLGVIILALVAYIVMTNKRAAPMAASDTASKAQSNL